MGETGGGLGLFVDIISNSENQLVLADDISSYLLEGNETFLIREHKTIASVFGENNSAGLQGGATAGSSDEILLWNPILQSFDSYFYSTVFSRWAPSTDPFNGDASNEIIYVDQGIVVLRKASDQKDIFIAGSVKLNATQALVYQGFNFYNNLKPVGVVVVSIIVVLIVVVIVGYIIYTVWL